MKAVALIAMLVGACSAESPSHDALPHDTYYQQLAYAGQCGSDVPPAWCIPKLSLCANGRFARLEGDVVTYGDYFLDGQTAFASGDYENFTFDLSSRVMRDQNSSTTSPPWDVVPFVGDLDCTYNAP